MVNPGPRTSLRSLPSRSTTPRSYCLTTLAAAAVYSAPAETAATIAITSSWTMTAP